MSAVTIRCKCGHSAGYQAFIVNQWGRPLPANKFRCPVCKAVETVRSARVAPLVAA
jgi:hypothetical protein